MGEHQIQCLEISMFPSHAIWSFKEDASCTECFIYVDMFTVADTYFNSAQLLESVLLVLESRIERLLTSFKLCNAFLSMHSILSLQLVCNILSIPSPYFQFYLYIPALTWRRLSNSLFSFSFRIFATFCSWLLKRKASIALQMNILSNSFFIILSRSSATEADTGLISNNTGE